MTKNLPSPSEGQFLFYDTEDSKIRIQVLLDGQTCWMPQSHIAELFETTPQNVTQHIKNIYADGELSESATCKIGHQMKLIERISPNGDIVPLVLADGDIWFSQSGLSKLFSTTKQNVSMHLADVSRRLDFERIQKCFSIETIEGHRKVRRNVVHVSHEISHLLALKGKYWEQLNWIVELTKEFELSKTTYRVLPVKERDFGDMLTGILDGIQKVQAQFAVDAFLIDFFLPEVVLAIEFDESHHVKCQEKDRNREELIAKSIPGIRFIRVKEGEELAGLNAIIKMIM